MVYPAEMMVAGPCLITAMAAFTLFIARGTLAPVDHVLALALSLSASMVQFGIAALCAQAHGAPDGGLPARLMGVAAAMLYAEGVRRRRGARGPRLAMALIGLAAAAALVVLNVVTPLAGLAVAVLPLARALLLSIAVPMVRSPGASSSFSERAVVAMLLAVAARDLSLVLVVVLEYLGLVRSHEVYLALAYLTVVPLSAALGLFALLLIASDFAAQRRLLIQTDPLTGVLNRLGFERATRGARRRGHSLSVAIADIDHFKAVNDSLGHAAGDAALACFATHLASGLSDAEAIGRVGGEEFALLLCDPVTAARDRVERLRAGLSSLRVDGFPDLRLAASIGIAQRRRGEAMMSVIARADEALYRAKRGGRDRTVVADIVGLTA